VHYTGKLTDGTVFDSSIGRNEPMEFTLGQGKLIPGFENTVDGMAVGDKETVTIPAVEAYGEPRPELILKLPKDKFPENIAPEIGQGLQLRQPDGGMFEVTVTNVEDDGITLDANHPLAGKDLVFEIELVDFAG
jgi:peptidylprolyl isomerase